MSHTANTILFTGGTSGIGLEAVRDLRSRGHRVIVGARNVDRAVSEIGLPKADVHPLDLSSFASVRAFADACPPADALVANAGVQVVSGTRLSEDGYEETLAVNHLAHYLLLARVLPKLSQGARVVFTQSGTHDPNEPLARRFGFKGGLYTSFDRLLKGDVGVEADDRMLGMHRYATSKLINVMTVCELARRVPSARANFYSYGPALVPATGLARDHANGTRRLYRLLTPLLELLPGASSIRTSGTALAWVTDSDEVGRAPSGSHFDFRRRPVKIWSEADDRAKCRDLFDGSARVTGETIANAC